MVKIPPSGGFHEVLCPNFQIQQLSSVQATISSLVNDLLIGLHVPTLTLCPPPPSFLHVIASVFFQM